LNRERKRNERAFDPRDVTTSFIHLPDAPNRTWIGQLTGNSEALWLGPNDSAIHRGDRSETGDEEARPDEMGSGFAQPTVDPTSFGGTTSIRHPESDSFDPAEELGDVDGMETMLPTDGRLGLTNVGRKPAEDWAADSGPTRSNEEQTKR